MTPADLATRLLWGLIGAALYSLFVWRLACLLGAA